MAYINGREILFSAKVNGIGGDSGGLTLGDVSIDDILARDDIQEYLDEHGITEQQVKKYL